MRCLFGLVEQQELSGFFFFTAVDAAREPEKFGSTRAIDFQPRFSVISAAELVGNGVLSHIEKEMMLGVESDNREVWYQEAWA